ncbi:hypothetical protein GCM10018785_27790 [Streptomyces longispororuber]|uniref:DUF397 domain-containing protein n=1 Tax=Streptomyces longispororuber TaxID=68230 RepID=A0A918ZLW7_9ACTN|nr:DUF397 domain-containing protein [Streptomyces longispororuber]GHE56982.1 hypothetical protein GCM10018785_27790 [Streptomyces longispororuber]
MHRHIWQKSSFSGNANNCLCVAATSDGRVHLRESDDPGVILTTGVDQFQALLGALRQQSAGGRR